MTTPISVVRYGNSKSDTPHTDTADFLRDLRDKGWKICRHRPIPEVQTGDHFDADAVQDHLDIERYTPVQDYIKHGRLADYDYWGSPTSADLDGAPTLTFYGRLTPTLYAMQLAHTIPILDHAGHNPDDRMEAWVAMVRAESGHEPIREPWFLRKGFCLERWYFQKMITREEPWSVPGHTAIRWFSPHTLPDGSLPWSGRLDHWLQHCESRGHTPAFTLNPGDTVRPADEYLAEVRAGEHNL